MENGILNKIIEAERLIQQRLDDEKTKAEFWLEERKRQTEQDLQQERARFAALCDDIRNSAEQAAHAEAEAILSAVRRVAEKVRLVKDETLKEIVQRHIIRILPEHSDDRPYGEGRDSRPENSS